MYGEVTEGRRPSVQPVNHPSEYKSFAGDPGQETGGTGFGEMLEMPT